MTVTERGVSEVVNQRVERGKDYQWRGERVFRASDEQRACGGTEWKQEIAEKNCANEKRVRVKKVAEGMFSGNPGGNDSSPGHREEKRWFSADEIGGAGLLLGEVGIFAELRVVAFF